MVKKAPKKVIFGTILLSLLTVFYLTINFASTRINLRQSAQSFSPTPEKVKVTNLSPNSFTVTWITVDRSVGSVVYGESKELIENRSNLSPRKEDERGTGLYYTHSVKIDGLTAGRRYYFKIVSGEKSFFKSISGDWREEGTAESVDSPSLTNYSTNSPPSESNSPGSYSDELSAFGDCANQAVPCFRPNIIYGQVNTESGSIITDALVYLEIPGKSTKLSSLAGNEGKWVLNLANLFRVDLGGYLRYQPGIDLVKISALGPGNSEAAFYRAIPSVIRVYQDPTNPVVLTLIAPPTVPTATITPTAAPTSTLTPTPTKTPTNTPIPPAGNLSLKIKIPERIGQNKDVTFSFYKATTLSFSRKIRMTLSSGIMKGEMALYRLGDFQLFAKADGFLRRSLGEITLVSGTNTGDFSEVELLAGDSNNDNIVNALDLSLLLTEQNENQKTNLTSDFNGDGKVDELDLSLLTANYRLTGD